MLKHLSIIQHNLGKSLSAQYSLFQIGIKRKADILVIQEPYINRKSKQPLRHQGYTMIIPPTTNNTHPRVAIYIKNISTINYLHRLDLKTDTDSIILEIQQPGFLPFLLINIYNEKDINRVYTLERLLPNLNLEREGKEILLIGDLNSHHS